MKVCLYTESFKDLDKKLMGLMENEHSVTVVSSEPIELPRTYWTSGLENPSLISGSFFIVHESYNPRMGAFSGIEFIAFDIILCCTNVKSFEPVEEHAFRVNIPVYKFDPGDDIDIDNFLEVRGIKDKTDKEGIFFNIVTAVYNTNLKFLKECVESVKNQTYRNFQWIIINDGSDEIITKSLEKIDLENEFITMYHFDKNRGIAVALTEGLKLCVGKYICFLDSDDILEENCLHEINNYIKNHPDEKFIYSNDREIELDGTLVRDNRKPDFSMELFYQTMYVSHIKVIHRDVLKEVGYPKAEYSGSWDYEYFLRIAEKFKVGHIRKFLYRWRRKVTKDGFLDDTGRQMIYHQHALKAIRESNKRTGLINGNIVPTEFPFQYRIERNLMRRHGPKIKLLILCKKNPNYLKLLLDSIEREAKYKNYEVIITQHIDEEDKNMTEFLKTVPYEVNECEHEGFNYSAITNWQIEKGLDVSDKYIMILNDDLIFQNDCVHEMIACMQAFEKENCGIVGCKLIWPGTDFKFYAKKYRLWPANCGHIQHAGVDLYSDKCCGHSYYGYPTSWLSANYVREVDTTTFACVLIKRDILDKIKFDEKLPVDYQDIDLCIRAKQMGYSCYYTPWAVSLHFESVTKERGRRDDFKYFEIKHREILDKYPTQDEVQNSFSQGL